MLFLYILFFHKGISVRGCCPKFALKVIAINLAIILCLSLSFSLPLINTIHPPFLQIIAQTERHHSNNSLLLGPIMGAQTVEISKKHGFDICSPRLYFSYCLFLHK